MNLKYEAGEAGLTLTYRSRASWSVCCWVCVVCCGVLAAGGANGGGGVSTRGLTPVLMEVMLSAVADDDVDGADGFAV